MLLARSGRALSLGSGLLSGRRRNAAVAFQAFLKAKLKVPRLRKTIRFARRFASLGMTVWSRFLESSTAHTTLSSRARMIVQGVDEHRSRGTLCFVPVGRQI